MEVFLRIDLNLYMAVVCVVVFFSGKNLTERRLVHNRVFRWLILTIIALLILECFTWVLDGAKNRGLLLLNYGVTTLLYILTPVPAALWALYVKCQIFRNTKSLKREMYLFGSLILISALMTILSPVTKWMFSFDSANIYHRGIAYPLLAAVSLFPVLYAFASILIHKNKLARKYFFLLLLFTFIIIGSALAQIVFYGIAVIWSSIAIAALLVHNNLQNDQVYTGHLTGIYNRRQMDVNLADRIQLDSSGRAFSCIMLDINRFKAINDTLGHLVGDDALRSAATILKSSIRKEDFLSRYGGDEFVILSDINDETGLLRLIERIKENASRFNTTANKPYIIDFSQGYAVYNDQTGMSPTEFLCHVDLLMYKNKQSHASQQADQTEMHEKRNVHRSA